MNWDNNIIVICTRTNKCDYKDLSTKIGEKIQEIK